MDKKHISRQFVKKGKGFLLIHRAYYSVLAIVLFFVGAVPKYRIKALLNLPTVIFFCLIGRVIRIYTQFVVLKCPYCNNLLEGKKGIRFMMSNIPYKCPCCGEILDEEKDKGWKVVQNEH